ncbi:unnamed protein product [marine sediment metagenome]|uniref:Uncharacterized protein n=1 Tax=marine sediment metagenome TaxID=412755 RepID=X1CHD9_9ZZZZ
MCENITLSVREQADMKVRAWKNRAKGKGVRWRMLRDTVSVVSSNWLTSYMVETCMIRIWGLTRKKTKELIEELVDMGDLLVEKDTKTGDMKYYLNRERARFWLGDQTLQAIPAGIVQVVELTKSVSALEV